MPPERVVAIPLADPLPQFSAEETPVREDTILLVGGPSRRKGSERFPQVIECWRRDLGWSPQVVWVGSASPEEAAVLAAALPEEARRRVRFLGFVSDLELDRLYRQCRALLLLSEAEGFAMPLLEATRRGCPVLAVSTDPLVEVLGTGAFWFAPNLGDLAAATRRLLDAREREAVLAAARARADAYSWEKTVAQTLAVYERVAARATVAMSS